MVIIYVQYYNSIVVDVLNNTVDVLCHRICLPVYSKLLSCKGTNLLWQKQSLERD